MVSKRRVAVRRNTAKPPKLSPGRRGNRSPLKDLSASLDRSLRGCRRRLIRAFARLVSFGASCARPSTPSAQRKRHRQGFLLLRNVDADDGGEEEEEERGEEEGRREAALSPAPTKPPGPRPLPPPACPGRKTLFLDLDETLVHSQADAPLGSYDFVVRPAIGGQVLTFFVAVRPGAHQLLAEAAGRFEVVVFTAGLREYASLVLSRLDPGGDLISHRLYRDSCVEVDGRLAKDLAAAGRDLSRVMIVDDNPNSYSLQPENAVPVSAFLDNPDDQELWRVMEFFAVVEAFDDTREAIRSFLRRKEEEPGGDPRGGGLAAT